MTATEIAVNWAFFHGWIAARRHAANGPGLAEAQADYNRRNGVPMQPLDDPTNEDAQDMTVRTPQDLDAAFDEGVELDRLSFQEANLSGVDLSGVDLSGVDLSGADLSHADLSGCNLTGTGLLFVDLEGANLSGTIHESADLDVLFWGRDGE